MTTITTINKAVSLIRENNPGCYITRGMIENAIRKNEIGCISVGTRKLVDVDLIREYLDNACKVKPEIEVLRSKKS